MLYGKQQTIAMQNEEDCSTVIKLGTKQAKNKQTKQVHYVDINILFFIQNTFSSTIYLQNE